MLERSVSQIDNAVASQLSGRGRTNEFAGLSFNSGLCSEDQCDDRFSPVCY